MRRILSLQASQAVFATVPRTLTVVGLWLACSLLVAWVGPYISPWLIMVGSLLLYAFTIYLGSVWLERDILRESRKHSEGEHGVDE